MKITIKSDTLEVLYVLLAEHVLLNNMFCNVLNAEHMVSKVSNLIVVAIELNPKLVCL